MRITFFAAKSYDRESFNKIKDNYPELDLEYWETELSLSLIHISEPTRH